MSTTTTRDLSTHENVIAFLEEVLGEIGCENFHDYAGSYGEPGYELPDGATPMVVLGSYWCRCGSPEFGTYANGDPQLHDIFRHYPEEAEILEEQGVQFEWYDEWVVISDEDAAYRTQSDSYHWKPSAIVPPEWCEYLTPKNDDETWIEAYVNQTHGCIPEHVLDKPMDQQEGWEEWESDSYRGFQNGWHPGQDDDPSTIDAAIRDTHGEDTDVVFVLSETSQFYICFKAFYRIKEED